MPLIGVASYPVVAKRCSAARSKSVTRRSPRSCVGVFGRLDDIRESFIFKFPINASHPCILQGQNQRASRLEEARQTLLAHRAASPPWRMFDASVPHFCVSVFERLDKT